MVPAVISVLWLGGVMCWDQQTLRRSLDTDRFHHVDVPYLTADRATLPAGSPLTHGGAVVVVPARYFTAEQARGIVAPLEWCVLILTSDEESTFDTAALELDDRHRIWVMTPRPGQHPVGQRYLGEGCAYTSDVLGEASPLERPRTIDVQFAGQVTHERRHQMAEAFEQLTELGINTAALYTHSFTAGMDRDEYLRQMATSRVVLAPSGPATPDSFRLYEAIEAGAVPIADGLTPGYPDAGYWWLTYPQGVPFPVVHDWGDELAKTVQYVLEAGPALATRCQAWWLGQQRQLRTRIEDDVAELADMPLGDSGDEITVLIPTSPTDGGPERAIEILATTIDSVRAQLPDAEVIVMCDGVRAEQEHLRDEYEAFLVMVTWSCLHRWQRVWPLVFDHHAHQANTTRVALEHVRTPLVLFVEHDTPLCGEIPWPALAELVRSGEANLVRLHHEAHVLEPHRHLMVDDPYVWTARSTSSRSVPIWRTVQWSQRPHLVATGYYRSMIGQYFGTESRTMIEDVMHGVVQAAWRMHGRAGWEQHRLVMYAPDGDMKRSLHLDGRGDAPKFDMRYRYDGARPEGAPAETP